MVSAVYGQQELLACEGVLDAELFISSGVEVNEVSVGTERSGFIIACGETAADAFDNARSAEKTLVQITFDPKFLRALRC